jgi:hypothetical protein
MGAAVVHDQVDVQILCHRLLDLSQEAQELLVAVARSALAEYLASDAYLIVAGQVSAPVSPGVGLQLVVDIAQYPSARAGIIVLQKGGHVNDN